MNAEPLSSLAHGNRLQRAYHAWAQPYYARMEPTLRADAERMDLFLYTRRGLGLWLGMAGAMLGSVLGLRGAGFPWGLALVCSAVVWLGVPLAMLSAWLQPQKFTWQQVLRKSGVIVLLGYLGGLVGFMIGRVARHGGLKTETLAGALWEAARLATPLLAVGAVAMMALLVGVAAWRRERLQRELAASQAAQAALQREQARLRLEAERDAAARQAAEARLRLLQAQIQPHFIFNTLAAVQHWVDTADPRAAALLRSLSAFLRGSTEQLAREQVTLAEEMTMVGHYLDILQARLGARLQYRCEMDPALAAVQLPPGLLLTLVENAVEHGVAPSLQGGTVQVQARATAEGWQLCVHDDGQGLDAAWQDGVGLANCRERLRHHFGERARLRLEPLQPGTRACIHVREPAHHAQEARA